MRGDPIPQDAATLEPTTELAHVHTHAVRDGLVRARVRLRVGV